MKLRDDWLETLLACVDEGTFEGASAALGVSPSAISQRIKALEQAVGQVVLVRVTPVRATSVGEVLLRAARQRALVDAELRRALRRGERRVGRRGGGVILDLPVAVNADSLATWFVEVLATVGEWGDARLRVFVEDQDHSARLLREGAVLGAVTASSSAVQGCSVRELGVMRYVPLVRRDVWELSAGDLAAVPTLRFNDRDDLQRRVLAAGGIAPRVEHVVPSAEGFAAAVRAGLGWGMVPEGLAAEDDLLVRVPGVGDLDVPLFWQCWRLETEALARLTDEATSAAHRLR